MRRVLVFAFALGAAAVGSVGAQGRPLPPRQQLERQLGERIAVMVKNRVGLNDQQMRQLQRVNQRFELQRRTLLQQERETRRSMREELFKGAAANDQVVDELMTRGIRIQRERIDLLEREQQALGEFMTPVQRAKYFGIQEQIRRQMEEMRRQNGARGGRGLPPDSDW